MSKVNHEQNAIDQRIAQRDKGINTALRQTCDKEIDPLAQGIFASHKGEGCTDN